MNFRVMLSSFQVVMLSASSFLPLTYFFFPRLAVTYGFTDSLWGVLGLVILGIVIAWVHKSLNNLFPNRTGADYLKLAFGKVIGTFVGGIYLPMYILFLGMSMYNFSVVIQFTLPTTPIIGIVLPMCAVCFIGAWYGVESLARVASIIYPLTFLGVFVTLCFIVGQISQHEMSFAFTSSRAVAEVVYHGMPTFLGYSIILMLNPYYQHMAKSAGKLPFFSMGMNCWLVFANFLTTILVLGYQPTRMVAFPFPFLLRLLRLNGFIVERVGISVVILTTAFTLLFISNHIWALSTLTARVFFVKDDMYKHFMLPIALMTTIVAVSFENEQQSFDVLRVVLVPWSWLLLLLIPAVIWVVAKIRGFGQTKASRQGTS